MAKTQKLAPPTNTTCNDPLAINYGQVGDCEFKGFDPENPDDEGLCIQVIEGPFSHVVVKFKNFQTYQKLNDDGSLDCDYQYDIVHAPSTIGENDITDEQGEIFEKKLGESIIELLWEAAQNENRSSNTEKSNTE